MFEYFAQLLTYDVLGLIPETKLALALEFFFYDVFKILFLIFVVVTLVAFVRTFFAPEKIKEFISKAKYGTGNLVASIFGAVTPFCSCSSVPLFVGFIKAKIPLSIAFSFLITSPLVNEVVFVMMGGLFGWSLAFIYALTGILLGVVAGLVLGFLKLDSELILEDEMPSSKSKNVITKNFWERLSYASREGQRTFSKLLFYIVAGVAVGALVHGYVPQEFFTDYVTKYQVLSVPLAVLVGVPIYAGCSTVVPVIFSITANGVPLGTSLAFMMSIAGLSLPEAVILKRVLSFKLLAIFFALVSIGITLIGYLFNFLTNV